MSGTGVPNPSARRSPLADSLPPFAGATVFPVVAVHLALHFYTIAVTHFGAHRDEFLYFSMGQHLRIWRMDFPPLIAILANVSRALFDHRLAAMRIFPAVEGAFLVVLAALIARELGGGRLAQGLAALCVLAGPMFQRTTTLFQPVVLDEVWWTLGLYFLIRLGTRENHREWLRFGVAMGLGLLTKFSILLLGFAVLVAVGVTPARRWLKTPWPWIAAAIAFALGSPSIIGQILLHFPVVGQMQEIQREQFVHVSWSGFLTIQPVLVGPVPLLLAVAGIAGLMAKPEWRELAVAGWACLVVFTLILLLRGKPYYVGGIYPGLFAAGSVMLERTRLPRGTVALRIAAYVVTIIMGALAVPIGMPLLAPQSTARYAERLGIDAAVRTNRGEMDRLPQDFADMLGWEQQAQGLAAVVAALPPEEQQVAVILAGNYGEAGAAEFYGPVYGLPPVVSPAGSFRFFGAGGRPGTVGVSIGIDSARLASRYDDVRVASVLRSAWSVAEERQVTIAVGRRPKQSLQDWLTGPARQP